MTGPRAAAAALSAIAVVAVPACSRGTDAPKAAARAPATAHADAAPVALCEHKVPADLCTQCNPDLAPVFQEQGDWCDEHGVPESQCLRCNPDLKFTAAVTPVDWCKEHAVPESKCTKCNPKLVARFVAAGDYCRDHGYPASVCPICKPELVVQQGAEPPVFPEPGLKVRLASAETVREAGIQTQRVEKRDVARTLDVVGQLQFEPNRHAQLSARSDSLVVEVLVAIGDEVKAGQALVVLGSSAVGAEQARLSAARARVETARAALERETALAEKRVSAQKDVEEARRELAAAQSDRDAALAALRASGAAADGSGGRYALRAPFAGTVVARDASAGRSATAGQVLVELANLSTLSAELDVPEADATLVRPGQSVQLTIEGRSSDTRSVRISAVGATVDPQSRTVRARAPVSNPDRSLRAGMFVRAKIALEGNRQALLVPRSAVQYAQGRALVFVEKQEALYEPVAVVLGHHTGDLVEVVGGLPEGAAVVTTGAFLLKTEILKESIGAGCCEEGPPS